MVRGVGRSLTCSTPKPPKRLPKVAVDTALIVAMSLRPATTPLAVDSKKVSSRFRGEWVGLDHDYQTRTTARRSAH